MPTGVPFGRAWMGWGQGGIYVCVCVCIKYTNCAPHTYTYTGNMFAYIVYNIHGSVRCALRRFAERKKSELWRRRHGGGGGEENDPKTILYTRVRPSPPRTRVYPSVNFLAHLRICAGSSSSTIEILTHFHGSVKRLQLFTALFATPPFFSGSSRSYVRTASAE